MSLYAITQYQNELEKMIQYGGSKKETAIRDVFYNLLNNYARGKDLMLIPEISIKNKGGKIITYSSERKEVADKDQPKNKLRALEEGILQKDCGKVQYLPLC